MKIFSAIRYYCSSIPTLLTQINPLIIPSIVLKKPAILETNTNLKFYVDSLMDIWTIKEVVLDRHYDRFHSIQKDDIVIDIGAGIGDFSILANKIKKKERKKERKKEIFAFEIDQTRFDLMKRNILINHCENICLTKTEVKSLDKIFCDNGIISCDFLKIDCEGCEYNIFEESSSGALKKIKYIAMEIHLFNHEMKRDYKKLKKRLKRDGFNLIELENPVYEYLKFLYASRF